jgi:hypothetical protein
MATTTHSVDDVFDESHKIGRNALGLLPVEGVTGRRDTPGAAITGSRPRDSALVRARRRNLRKASQSA